MKEKVGNKLLFSENGKLSVIQDEKVLENLLYNIVLIVNNTVYFKVVKRVNLMFFTTICFLMNEFWLHKTMLKVYVCSFVLHHSFLQIIYRLCQSNLWLPAANQFEDFNKKQKLLEACLSHRALTG